jgi:FAD/FMN-containing dehydrogenase
MHTYNEVTTANGRYVQGGGCATVGVAGLIQSGGFGSFSKYYGTAAAALIEAEVVTADGKVRIANACREPELYWALKGGGGGTFGVVTKVTLRTRELPEFFGGAFGSVRAKSDEAFRRLIAQTMSFYKEKLFNRHWGEQIVFRGDNLMNIRMVFAGLDQKQADATWEPFRKWLLESPADFKIEAPLMAFAIPARSFWDASFWKRVPQKVVVADDRPDAPAKNIYWLGDAEQPGQFLHGYGSAWLPSSLLELQINRVSSMRFLRRAGSGDSRCTLTKDWPEHRQPRSKPRAIRRRIRMSSMRLHSSSRGATIALFPALAVTSLILQ